MSEAGFAGAESEMEVFGQFGANIERLRESNIDSQTALFDYVKYRGDPNAVMNQYYKHCVNLGSTIYQIFDDGNNENYPLTESIDLVADILYQDDTRRVQQYKGIDGKMDLNGFASHYVSRDQVFSHIQRLFVESSDEPEPFKKLTVDLVNYHFAYMQLDFRTLLKSDVMKIKSRETKTGKFDAVDFAAITTAALAIGGVVAGMAWKKFKKYL